MMNTPLTLEKIHEQVSRVENCDNARIALTLKDEQRGKHYRYELSNSDLHQIDSRLATGIKTLIENPLGCASLRSATCEYQRANLLKKSIELWNAGEGNYLIDDPSYKAVHWRYVAKGNNGQRVTVEWDSFTVYRCDGLLTILEAHPTHCEIKSVENIEDYYPGILNALTIAETMELSQQDNALFCMRHVNKKQAEPMTILPNNMAL